MYFCVDEMLPCWIVFMFLALQSAADPCNWTGSGFAAGMDSRLVLQVRLRCSEGWVRWVYPGQALRVVLEPNLSSTRGSTVCIKPSRAFFGEASVFLERGGELEVLGMDQDQTRHQVFCFRADGAQRPAIYLQVGPQRDAGWSRRTVGFRYEVMGNRSAVFNHRGMHNSCRPCNDTELLMAICNSDFVVRGSIKSVSHVVDRNASLVEVSAAKVYWQRGNVFEQERDGTESPLSWRGHVHTLLQCHVKPGEGEFLFTGSEHFGEAWLGCAPRYKDFLSVYHAARTAHRNSCDFPSD